VSATGDDPVRRLLRDLPEVAPPAGFYDQLIRRRRRRARAVACGALAAAVVVGALVVGHASGITGQVVPRLGELIGRHESVVTVNASTLTGLMPADEVPAPFQAPAELGGLQRGMAVRFPDDVVQIVYGNDALVVSVFEEAGDLDEADMPDGLTLVEMGGAEAWAAPAGELAMLVVSRDHVVYVVIGDLSPEAAAAVVEDLPDARPMSLPRRIGDAMDDLVSAFGLD
jgi:hypothetical protein